MHVREASKLSDINPAVCCDMKLNRAAISNRCITSFNLTPSMPAHRRHAEASLSPVKRSSLCSVVVTLISRTM